MMTMALVGVLFLLRPCAPLSLQTRVVGAAERIAERWDLGRVDWAAEVGLPDDVGASVLSLEPLSTSNHPLAWVSICQVGAETGLTVWCGPLTDCPHLAARVDVGGGSLRISCDFRPRLDGGYENADVEPASRAAFAQKSTREAYARQFFTPEMDEWRRSAIAGATVEHPRPLARVVSRTGSGARGSDDGSPIAGPLFFDVEKPLSDEAIADAARTIDDAVDAMLGWLEDLSVDTASASSWMTSRLAYDRDCLVRAKVFADARASREAAFGPEVGLALAYADAGKMDMIGHNTLGRGGTLG